MEAALLQYGLPGICIAALGLTVKRLFELYTTSLEARLKDSLAFQVSLNDLANRQTDATRALTEALKATNKGASE